jgi:hypothetical protein
MQGKMEGAKRAELEDIRRKGGKIASISSALLPSVPEVKDEKREGIGLGVSRGLPTSASASGPRSVFLLLC